MNFFQNPINNDVIFVYYTHKIYASSNMLRDICGLFAQSNVENHNPAVEENKKIEQNYQILDNKIVIDMSYLSFAHEETILKLLTSIYQNWQYRDRPNDYKQDYTLLFQNWTHINDFAAVHEIIVEFKMNNLIYLRNQLENVLKQYNFPIHDDEFVDCLKFLKNYELRACYALCGYYFRSFNHLKEKSARQICIEKYNEIFELTQNDLKKIMLNWMLEKISWLDM